MKPKKILFITPTFGRTGSELVLWYLLQSLDRSKYEPYLFCLNKGELVDLLPNGIKVSVSYRGSGIWYKKAFRGLLKAVGVEPISYQLAQIQKKINADFWYANTIVIPQAHVAAHQKNIKIVTHIHELFFAFTFIKRKDFEHIINYSDTLIGCSALVCKALEDLEVSNIALQESFINETKINPNTENINRLKAKFGILDSDFVWVVSGTAVYMKGLDSVLKVASSFQNTPNVKIIWIGSGLDNGLDYYVKTVAAKKYPNLVFVGAAGRDYYDYLSIGNGFLLLSREESLSLALVEAAYLGIPLVAFDAGIAREFIKTGMGHLVDSWKIDDLKKAMEDVMYNFIANKPKLKAAAEQYSIAAQLPKFEELLSKF